MKPLFEHAMPHAKQGRQRHAFVLAPPRVEKRTEHQRQRGERVGRQIAQVQQLAHRPLRQRREHQRRQRELDDELAERAQVGLREHLEAHRQKAERDHDVDRAGDGQGLQHRVARAARRGLRSRESRTRHNAATAGFTPPDAIGEFALRTRVDWRQTTGARMNKRPFPRSMLRLIELALARPSRISPMLLLRKLARRAGRRFSAMHLLAHWYAAAIALCLFASGGAHAQQVVWARTIGSFSFRITPMAVAANANGVYVATDSGGGGGSSYVRKYDAAGLLVWQSPLAVSSIADIAVDASGVYVVSSSLVARFGHDGSLRWTQPLERFQIDTLALRAGALYAAGFTYTASGRFLRVVKLDRDGHPLWPAPTDVLMPDDNNEGGVPLKMVVDDSAVYISGFIGAADVRRFDPLSGSELAPLGSGSALGFATLGIGQDSAGIYVLAPAPDAVRFVDDPAGRSIRKYARDGRLLWQRELAEGDFPARPISARVLVADASGVYVAGNNTRGTFSGEATVRRFNPGGDELWSHELPNMPGAPRTPIGAALHDGHVYVLHFNYPENLLVKLSQDLPSEGQALQDADGALKQRLAVLQHDNRSRSVSVQVKDAASGAAVRRIAFDPNNWPRQLLRLPDFNGNGSDDLALLGVHSANGTASAEIRDGRTGAFIRQVGFGRQFTPRKLLALTDVNGNGTPDLALLSSSQTLAPTVIDMRDGSTGALIKRIALPSFSELRLLDFATLPDSNGNAVPELAALGCDRGPPANLCRLVVHDGSSGERLALRTVAPATVLEPFALVALPDSNADGRAEVAILNERADSNAFDLHAEIFDADSQSPMLREIRFDTAGALRQMVAVPDINGNGYPELAVLQMDVRPNQGAIQIQDALDGSPIRRIRFASTGLLFRGLTTTGDLNGNGSAELVVLLQHKGSNRSMAMIRDARTGALVRSIEF
jgi:outer membrane protein assembly factor BamB